MNKKELEYQHELKMLELAYERETKLMVEETKWKLNNRPDLIEAPQPPQIPQEFLQQLYANLSQPKQNLTEAQKSQQKYGGKKNG